MSLSFIKPPVIGDANTLPWIKAKNITAFSWRFRKTHTYLANTNRYFDNRFHPLLPMVKKRYEARKEPFWWSCITQRAEGRSDRVVRSWLARRTRNALIESLKKVGYDADGRRLPGREVGGDQSDLYGTAQIYVELAALKMSYEDLVEQTDKAVLIMKKSQDEDSRPTSRSLFSGRRPFGKPRWQK